jgi:hypothetical protein
MDIIPATLERRMRLESHVNLQITSFSTGPSRRASPSATQCLTVAYARWHINLDGSVSTDTAATFTSGAILRSNLPGALASLTTF